MTDIKDIPQPYTLESRWSLFFGTYVWLCFEGTRIRIMNRISAKEVCELMNAAYRMGWAQSEIGR